MKPTVGRIVHVYSKEGEAVERGPFMGQVLAVAPTWPIMCVRVLKPHARAYDLDFSVNDPNVGHTQQKKPNISYRWCWPPKETE